MQLITKTTKLGSTEADTDTTKMGSIYRKTSRKVRAFTFSSTALALGAVAILLLFQAPQGSCQTEVTSTETTANTTIAERQESSNSIKCQEGLMLSVWQPQDNLTFGDRFSRGLVYFFALCLPIYRSFNCLRSLYGSD